MSLLDCFDENQSASREKLNRIARDVTISDVQDVAKGDLPLESKRSQLSGLIQVLHGTGRDDVRCYAQGILKLIEADGSDFKFPEITS